MLLEACRLYGGIKRFINVSTDEVYGETSLGKVRAGCCARQACCQFARVPATSRVNDKQANTGDVLPSLVPQTAHSSRTVAGPYLACVELKNRRSSRWLCPGCG